MHVIPLHPPDTDTIELLRDLLAQAEAGELQSLIYSAERIGGQIQRSSQIAGQPSGAALGPARLDDCRCRDRAW